MTYKMEIREIKTDLMLIKSPYFKATCNGSHFAFHLCAMSASNCHLVSNLTCRRREKLPENEDAEGDAF